MVIERMYSILDNSPFSHKEIMDSCKDLLFLNIDRKTAREMVNKLSNCEGCLTEVNAVLRRRILLKFLTQVQYNLFAEFVHQLHDFPSLAIELITSELTEKGYRVSSYTPENILKKITRDETFMTFTYFDAVKLLNNKDAKLTNNQIIILRAFLTDREQNKEFKTFFSKLCEEIYFLLPEKEKPILIPKKINFFKPKTTKSIPISEPKQECKMVG